MSNSICPNCYEKDIPVVIFPIAVPTKICVAGACNGGWPDGTQIQVGDSSLPVDNNGCATFYLPPSTSYPVSIITGSDRLTTLGTTVSSVCGTTLQSIPWYAANPLFDWGIHIADDYACGNCNNCILPIKKTLKLTDSGAGVNCDLVYTNVYSNVFQWVGSQTVSYAGCGHGVCNNGCPPATITLQYTFDGCNISITTGPGCTGSSGCPGRIIDGVLQPLITVGLKITGCPETGDWMASVHIKGQNEDPSTYGLPIWSGGLSNCFGGGTDITITE